jgi:DUF1365 family protein
VSFYYCFDAGGTLHSIVAEITNTPWKERHAYVLPVATAERRGGTALAFRQGLPRLAVPADAAPLRLAFTEPGDGLQVHMDVCDGRARIRRHPATGTPPTDRRERWRACCGAIR